MVITAAACAISLLILILPAIWIVLSQRSKRNFKLTCYVLVLIFAFRLGVGIFAAWTRTTRCIQTWERLCLRRRDCTPGRLPTE